MSDRAVVGLQIERPSRAEPEVVARCHLGLPVVVRMPPILEDGTPFPTRYWLTCPLARRRVGRVEGTGAVATMTTVAETDAEFRSRLEAAHRRYAADRDADVPVGSSARPEGGIAGTVGAGVKCLHAHFADYAAGNDNPVGEATAPWIEPLNCAVPCVLEDGGGAARNPAWREPK